MSRSRTCPTLPGEAIKKAVLSTPEGETMRAELSVSSSEKVHAYIRVRRHGFFVSRGDEERVHGGGEGPVHLLHMCTSYVHAFFFFFVASGFLSRVR